MTTKKGISLKGKIKIDLSEWELGNWPDDISKIVRVDIEGDGSINIEISGDIFTETARKIAQEAVEAFFEEEIYFIASSKGLIIESHDGKKTTVPWGDLMLGQVRPPLPAAVAALKWIEAELDLVDREDPQEQKKVEDLRRSIAALIEKV